MTNDDERVYRAARAAAAQTRQRLGQARAAIVSAGTQFKSGVGIASWGTVGDKLNKNKASAAHYKELQAAIRAAETAIAHAEAACDALLARLRTDQT
jgi:hypothetical protein